MKNFFPVLFLTAFMGMLGIYAAKSAEDTAHFHLPQTQAEKVLDRIFILQDKDRKDLFRFIYKDPQRTMNWDKDYSRFFTQALQDAWTEEYKNMPEEEGGSRYVSFNYVVCGQDQPDVFLYRTVKSSANEAILTYAWPEHLENRIMEDGPLYKMIKSKEGWKLDGIECGGNEKFNME